MDRVVLPKQWRDWCASMRLVPHGKRGHGQHQWFYLKGRGHYWRVNCHGMLQCGDLYDDFDRWALCRTTQVELPKTKAEFQREVRWLLNRWNSILPGDIESACWSAGVKFEEVCEPTVEHNGKTLTVVTRVLEAIGEFQTWLETEKPSVVYFHSLSKFKSADQNGNVRELDKIRLAWTNDKNE